VKCQPSTEHGLVLCSEEATEPSGLCWTHDYEETERAENAEAADNTGRCMYLDPIDGEPACFDPCTVRGLDKDGNTIAVTCEEHRRVMDEALGDRVGINNMIVWVAP